MATNIVTPYKLTKVQKKALVDLLEGRKGIQETAALLGMTKTRIYVMATSILRHAASTGTIDAKTLIAKY